MLKNYGQQDLKKSRNKTSCRKVNYNVYQYTGREWVFYGIEGILIVMILGYFFYRSWIGTCFLSPLIILFLKSNRKELGKRQRDTLCLQFKDTLRSVNSSLQAGYSMENAFMEAYKDMQQYYGKNSIIARELTGIQLGLRNNYPIEDLIQELGVRSGVEDILDFAEILLVGKKSGGNINEIIDSWIVAIEEKTEMKQDIQVLISAKKLETKIMAVIPFFIILYIEATSRGYFDSMYHTAGGHFLMTICLGIYLLAVFLSLKIINIDVL